MSRSAIEKCFDRHPPLVPDLDLPPRGVGATIEAEVRAVHKTAIDFYRAITKGAR